MSAPRLSCRIDGATYALRDLGPEALVLGLDACPRCGRREAVRVQGSGKRIAGHDVYEADGFAVCCGAPLGTIRAQVSTIFGLEEDERVLRGRARVY